MNPDREVRSDEARRNLSALIDEVRFGGEHVTILRYDKPAAVLVSVEWYTHARKEIGNENYDREGQS